MGLMWTSIISVVLGLIIYSFGIIISVAVAMLFPVVVMLIAVGIEGALEKKAASNTADLDKAEAKKE